MQIINLKIDFKTLYYSLLEEKTPIIKHNRLKQIYLFKQQPQEQPHEITRTGYTTKTFSDRLIDLCVPRDVCKALFCVFGAFYAPGMQDTEATKSLKHHGNRASN